MFELLNKLRNKEADGRQKLIARYREILQAGDFANIAQIDELQAIMEKLGYSAEKVAADAEALVTRGKLLLLVEKTDDARKRMTAATSELAQWSEEADRIDKENRRKSMAFLDKKNAAERAYGECNNARRKLIELSTTNRELFAIGDGEIGRMSEEFMGRTVDPLPIKSAESAPC